MKIKRLLAFVISVAMIVGMVPTFVFAKEIDPEADEPATTETTEAEEEEKEEPAESEEFFDVTPSASEEETIINGVRGEQAVINGVRED